MDWQKRKLLTQIYGQTPNADLLANDMVYNNDGYFCVDGEATIAPIVDSVVRADCPVDLVLLYTVEIGCNCSSSDADSTHDLFARADKLNTGLSK